MFIEFLVEKKVIPESSRGIWQYVADDQLKEMLIKFDVIDQKKADYLWLEYKFTRKRYEKNL